MEVNNSIGTEMKTLSALTTLLEKEGFNTTFQVDESGLKSFASDRVYSPNEVCVSSFYRFEGESNPEDNSILYAIEAISGEKGLLIDAYGSQGDINISNFIVEVENIQKKVHTDK
ncbi:hypothetical protein [uncultured Cytophaga sp.]|mgnify:CR=1 FL=1|uniref:hypothetical protein n=1 Tax=uncultured Cytophaga sp. TaxID=160238 RepID=UPI00261DD900|nr:hypothetical protein [uncultured Cytophaga sp.]